MRTQKAEKCAGGCAAMRGKQAGMGIDRMWDWRLFMDWRSDIELLLEERKKKKGEGEEKEYDLNINSEIDLVQVLSNSIAGNQRVVETDCSHRSGPAGLGKYIRLLEWISEIEFGISRTPRIR